MRARAPGRGAWVGVTRAELDETNAKGKLKGALQRAFKTSAVTVPADLATDELIQKKRVEPRRKEPSNRPEDKGGILGEYGLSEEQGNEIIMAARAHWFEDEAPAQTEEAANAESPE